MDAARPDLADVRLADRIFAPHYAAAVLRTAIVRADVMGSDGRVISEILMGEPFEVLELSADRAWGVSPIDGSVGHIAVAALGEHVVPTHVVCVPLVMTSEGKQLPFGTRLAGVEADDMLTIGTDRVALAAVRPLAAGIADVVALTETLVGTPVVEGGRSGAGIDAAGLVSLVLSLGGIAAPRFADLQAQKLGHEVSATSPILRGDLLFPETGGVAMATDDRHVVHALADAVIVASIDILGPIAMRRRLP